MLYRKEVLVTVFALVHLSVQDDYNEAHRAISVAMKKAEARLTQAMADIDPSVLVGPMKELEELKEAGLQDLENIQNFEASGDKDEAFDSSAHFWKGKMKEIIKPYIKNPEEPRRGLGAGSTTSPTVRNHQEIMPEVPRIVSRAGSSSVGRLKSSRRSRAADAELELLRVQEELELARQPAELEPQEAERRRQEEEHRRLKEREEAEPRRQEEDRRLAKEHEEAERRRQEEERRPPEEHVEAERRRQEEERRRSKEREEAECLRQEEERRRAKEREEAERRRQEEECRPPEEHEEAERSRAEEHEEAKRRT